MRKYKLRKQVIVIPVVVLFLILILFFIIAKSNNNYSIEYNIDNFNIGEYYDKDYLSYYFEIKYNNKNYPFIFESDRLKNKKIIKDIYYIEEGSISCLNIISDYFETIPICYDDDSLQDISLVEIEELDKYRSSSSSKEKELNNYTIYNNDKNILIWNYKGFNYINDNTIKEIKIFNKDIYEIPFYMMLNNYILIPDYEQNYTFNKIYIIDTDNMKVSKWTIDYNISFNSIVLGENDKSIFILDKQNKKEYELVPHKQKIRIVSSSTKGIIYEYGKAKKVLINSLKNNSSLFKYYNNYKYELIDNKIYLSYTDRSLKYQITKQSVDKIVFMNNDSVYYISKDKLYGYTPKKGEYLIMSYSEFIYNKNIPIFIN